MAKKYKAVIFDMDGVITDSEKIYRRFEHEVGEKYGMDYDTMEEFCKRIAGGTYKTNRHHFDEMIGLPMGYNGWRDEVMELVDAWADGPGFDLKSGVREVLDYLKGKGIKLAVATSTSKDRAEKNLKKCGIYEYFDVLVFGDMIEHGKPSPDIYLKAAELCGVEPEYAIGVEDSINGLRSSHAAGLFTVMVIDLIEPDDVARANADEIFTSITELKNII